MKASEARSTAKAFNNNGEINVEFVQMLMDTLLKCIKEKALMGLFCIDLDMSELFMLVYHRCQQTNNLKSYIPHHTLSPAQKENYLHEIVTRLKALGYKVNKKTRIIDWQD